MSISIVILLILLGLIFVMLEILVIPGVGFVGAIGGILIIIAIYGAYGIQTSYGHLALAGSIMLSVLTIYLSLKSNTWKNLSLNQSIEGKVNTFDEQLLSVGDTGVAVSRLAPMGKALIKDNLYEVQSKEGYITENSEIIIDKLSSDKIIVKLKT